ncbi:MAG: hypothetical protein RLZZ612_823, partial [Pseudomonadota bacterium]
ALDSGNGLGIVSSFNALTDSAVDGAINSALGSSGIPYLSIVTSLANFEDNPAQSIGSLVGMYFGGPIGAAIGGFIGGMLGGLFGDDDMPMREGHASAYWNAVGDLVVHTDQDSHGGGPTATHIMQSLAQGLQQQRQSITDPQGQPLYGLIAERLPSIGYQNDPDGLHQSLQVLTTQHTGHWHNASAATNDEWMRSAA